MPLPTQPSEEGYKGVEISTTKLGFYVVHMSHNKHRFVNLQEARSFVDYAIKLREERGW